MAGENPDDETYTRTGQLVNTASTDRPGVAGGQPRRAGVTVDVQMVHGAMNLLFGGERVLNTVLTCPGTVWLQTMPMSGMANTLLAATRANKRR